MYGSKEGGWVTQVRFKNTRLKRDAHCGRIKVARLLELAVHQTLQIGTYTHHEHAEDAKHDQKRPQGRPKGGFWTNFGAKMVHFGCPSRDQNGPEHENAATA